MGNCTVRLPIIGVKDGGILGRRAFDNLSTEMRHVLDSAEQGILTESMLREIALVPNYKGLVHAIVEKMKWMTKDIF